MEEDTWMDELLAALEPMDSATLVEMLRALGTIRALARTTSVEPAGTYRRALDACVATVSTLLDSRSVTEQRSAVSDTSMETSGAGSGEDVPRETDRPAVAAGGGGPGPWAGGVAGPEGLEADRRTYPDRARPGAPAVGAQTVGRFEGEDETRYRKRKEEARREQRRLAALRAPKRRGRRRR